MTKRATRSIGTTFKLGTTPIGDLTAIGSPNVDTEEIDVTTLDSVGAYREYISGFKDAGEVTLSGYFVPTDAGQAAAYAALESGEIQECEIEYPMGASWAFEGFVKNFTVTTELEEAIGFEVTIRVTGQPTLTLPSSGGGN
ncbi:phage tail tube protein [Paenibacillus ginsengihumi]|uniref:phage tail tube protein n=1 Tax=Paenibacillus ginsengihumi TaxID=431596 RepID=UPI0003629D2F|nr:phage tail tube protein [Paenibacillus ginsengihumi]